MLLIAANVVQVLVREKREHRASRRPQESDRRAHPDHGEHTGIESTIAMGLLVHERNSAAEQVWRPSFVACQLLQLPDCADATPHLFSIWSDSSECHAKTCGRWRRTSDQLGHALHYYVRKAASQGLVVFGASKIQDDAGADVCIA